MNFFEQIESLRLITSGISSVQEIKNIHKEVELIEQQNVDTGRRQEKIELFMLLRKKLRLV